MIHRSGVYPRIPIPSWGTDDLQIGDTWTDPEYRGRGLATRRWHRSSRRAPTGAAVLVCRVDENWRPCARSESGSRSRGWGASPSARCACPGRLVLTRALPPPTHSTGNVPLLKRVFDFTVALVTLVCWRFHCLCGDPDQLDSPDPCSQRQARRPEGKPSACKVRTR